MSAEEPDYDALAGAAASLRQLISHLRKTQAPAELLKEVERETRALAARLAPHDHPGPYAQRRLVLREGIDHDRDTDNPVEFFPYSPIIGPLNPIAPPVHFEVVGREMRAVHTFDAQYNGPPTAVHGGVIALVFDELLGSIGAILDTGGLTGTLKVVYRSITPLGQPIRMRSWVDRVEGVKIFIKGEMHAGEGAHDRLCSEAEGIFIRPKLSVLEDALAKSKGSDPS
ncbi:MAG: PaaI family thioesterase [bacterium]|nr:hypothetical protein [Deltaproteobacteria bacterium]MCP4908601.1 PaaI family thioesterase [bacterium]